MEITEKIDIIESIIEDMQEAQIRAGGAFLRRADISTMTVEDLLDLLVSNNVEFIIKHNEL